LSIDTSTYLTGNQSISLTGDATGDGTTSIAVTVAKINGTSMSGLGTGILKNTTGTGVPSIAVAGDFPTLNQNTTGNAATVTTNANLTGPVTSVGNATTITPASVTNAMLAGSIDVTTKLTGVLAATQHPALTGDITTTSGSLATTLASTGVAAGTYGDSTNIPVITVDSKGRLTSASTVLAGGIQSFAVKTSNYTAVAGDRILANTSSGVFTINLPASPSVGDTVEIFDMQKTFDTNNLTVGRNAQLVDGNAGDLIANVENVHMAIVFVGGTQGWSVYVN
jgi:hypothetical protein